MHWLSPQAAQALVAAQDIEVQVNGSNSVASPSIGGTLKAPKGAVPVAMDPASVVRPAMPASGISAMQLAVFVNKSKHSNVESP